MERECIFLYQFGEEAEVFRKYILPRVERVHRDDDPEGRICGTIERSNGEAKQSLIQAAAQAGCHYIRFARDEHDHYSDEGTCHFFGDGYKIREEPTIFASSATSMTLENMIDGLIELDPISVNVTVNGMDQRHPDQDEYLKAVAKQALDYLAREGKRAGADYIFPPSTIQSPWELNGETVRAFKLKPEVLELHEPNPRGK